MATTSKYLVLLCAFGFCLNLASCGAGQYGFARYYEPTDEEKPYDEMAKDIPYGVVASKPDDFEGSLIAWFGIVKSMRVLEDGRHVIQMTYHQHKERHLCEDESSSSCRVTVNFKSSGEFSAALSLKPHDMVAGLDKVQPGTLLRVFGKVRCKDKEGGGRECAFDEQGGLILDAEFYRQWPARYYATTRAASSMRR